MDKSPDQMANARPVKAPEQPTAAVIVPALKVGLASGCGGFLLGGASGIIKGTTPFLFASAAGIQTFALGSTYWATRGVFLQAHGGSQRDPTTRLYASTVGGGVAGAAIGLLTRGRQNVLPGMLMFSVFGFFGQVASNRYYGRPAPKPSTEPGFWNRMSEKSWSPVKVMTNEEYADMLKERVFKVDVEIAVLEDKIAALKVEEQQQGTNENAQPSVSSE